MDIYQYDTPEGFCIRLVGDFEGGWVEELEHTCLCAASMLKGREIILDVAGITSASREGLEALRRLRGSGARFVASKPPEAPALAAMLEVPAVPEAPARVRGRRASPGAFLRSVWLAIHAR